jgi:hypothetical protein
MNRRVGDAIRYRNGTTVILLLVARFKCSNRNATYFRSPILNEKNKAKQVSRRSQTVNMGRTRDINAGHIIVFFKKQIKGTRFKLVIGMEHLKDNPAPVVPVARVRNYSGTKIQFF